MALTTTISRAHGRAAPARGIIYGWLTDLLVYPEPDLVRALGDGTVARSLHEAAEALPYELAVEGFDSVGDAELASLGPSYIATFDVPTKGSTCPLYGGALGGDRRETMEDLLRFYRHFGLSVAHADQRDLPDSVATVAEFLGFLVHRESDSSGDEQEAFRLAQRDVLGRHVCRWAPVIRKRVGSTSAPPLYRAVVALLDDFSAGEAQALSEG